MSTPLLNRRVLRCCLLISLLAAPLTGQTGPAPAPAGVTPALSQEIARINAIIEKDGREAPPWWNSVTLNFPATLDLSWPNQRPTRMSPETNVAHYFIRIINPHHERHKEGCKLMHHILAVNKDPSIQAKAMAMLGRIYGIYLHDYARGAFWYRKAAKSDVLNARDLADLAFYYYKLGSREMALASIDLDGEIFIPGQPGGTVSAHTVRVLGSIGKLDSALELARNIAEVSTEDAYLAAGDVCRYHGRFDEAVKWYEMLIAITPEETEKPPGLYKRFQQRAAASVEAARMFGKIDMANIPDGTYRGDSRGYRAPVGVEVAVKASRITGIKIVKTEEDWPLNVYQTVPAQIIEKQSVQGIDTISDATLTTEAVINATGKALAAGATK